MDNRSNNRTMRYTIVVDVDIEELEDNVGHVNDVADALAGMMSGNEYLGVTVVSIDKVEE